MSNNTKFLMGMTLLLGCICPFANAVTEEELTNIPLKELQAMSIDEFRTYVKQTVEALKAAGFGNHSEFGKKVHYDINPEFDKNVRHLVNLDRLALMTILENQAALFQALLVSSVYQAYNVGSMEAGHCATQKERICHQHIAKHKAEIRSVVDKSLDEMHRKWVVLQTQEDLEAYWLKYWEDRNKIYNFVSFRIKFNPGCEGKEMLNGQCTAVEYLEACFLRGLQAINDCFSGKNHKIH